MDNIYATDNLDFIYQALKSDGRLGRLVDELRKALDCYSDDEQNVAIRENIVFRQFVDRLLTDRERAVFYGLPEGCRMRENAKILSPENLKCGMHVWIGEGAILDASGGLEIGDHTSIGPGVYVWTHSSHMTNIFKANYPGSELIVRKPTKIGSGVFLAGPSVVSAGTVIGDRTLVQPMSYITESFEGKCVVGGNPARLINKL